MIITGPQTQAYRDGWDRIFGEEKAKDEKESITDWRTAAIREQLGKKLIGPAIHVKPSGGLEDYEESPYARYFSFGLWDDSPLEPNPNLDGTGRGLKDGSGI